MLPVKVLSIAILLLHNANSRIYSRPSLLFPPGRIPYQSAVEPLAPSPTASDENEVVLIDTKPDHQLLTAPRPDIITNKAEDTTTENLIIVYPINQTVPTKNLQTVLQPAKEPSTELQFVPVSQTNSVQSLPSDKPITGRISLPSTLYRRPPPQRNPKALAPPSIITQYQPPVLSKTLPLNEPILIPRPKPTQPIAVISQGTLSPIIYSPSESQPIPTAPSFTNYEARRTTMQRYSTPFPTKYTTKGGAFTPISTTAIPQWRTPKLLPTTSSALPPITTSQFITSTVQSKTVPPTSTPIISPSPTTTTPYTTTTTSSPLTTPPSPTTTTPYTTTTSPPPLTTPPSPTTTTPYTTTTGPPPLTTTTPYASTTSPPPLTTPPSATTTTAYTTMTTPPPSTTTTTYTTTTTSTPSPTTTPYTTTSTTPYTTTTLEPFTTTTPYIPTPQPIKTPTDKPVETLTNLTCNQPYYYYGVVNECHSYIECEEYVATKKTCPDGLLFKKDTVWPFNPCSYQSEVKCDIDGVLQPMEPTAECARQYGFYSVYKGDCSKYIMCQGGVPIIMNCPNGLVFNNKTSSCDWPVNVPSCNPKVFKNFKCPSLPSYDDGNIIMKYKYSNSCGKYIACHQGYPRLLSCDQNLSFDVNTQTCVDSKYVTDCDAFFEIY